MSYTPHNPIIVQSDKSVLLEVDSPHYPAARDILARFAELEKSPEHIHTYRITPLSLWNAASAGLTAETILAGLETYSKYPVPDNVKVDIADYINRYGRVQLFQEGDELRLTSQDKTLIVELSRHKLLAPYIIQPLDAHTLQVDPAQRGHIKQALVNIGYPAEDLAGYVDGEALTIQLSQRLNNGHPFTLRRYQQEAAHVFYAGGHARGGSGVIVLPCGAGKTVVGIAAMAQTQCNTLVLTPNAVAVRQWINDGAMDN